MAAKLRVTLVRSPISHTRRIRGTLRALGLHRIGETVEVPDSPQTRGMARAVQFLVTTETTPAAAGADRPAAEPAVVADKPADDQPKAGGEAAASAERETDEQVKPARRRRKKEESTA
jgi:large subunit ribosomal protein L30